MANIVELRELDDATLASLLDELLEEMFNLRFQKATGSLENTARIRTVRREIAQLKEVMGKRTWAIEEAASHEAIAPLLADQEWSASARYVYENGGWQVTLADANGKELATALVDLNKKRRRTRRQRDNIAPVEKVVEYEVA